MIHTRYRTYTKYVEWFIDDTNNRFLYFDMKRCGWQGRWQLYDNAYEENKGCKSEDEFMMATSYQYTRGYQTEYPEEYYAEL